jgi:hypothetical protein
VECAWSDDVSLPSAHFRLAALPTLPPLYVSARRGIRYARVPAMEGLGLSLPNLPDQDTSHASLHLLAST